MWTEEECVCEFEAFLLTPSLHLEQGNSKWQIKYSNLKKCFFSLNQLPFVTSEHRYAGDYISDCTRAKILYSGVSMLFLTPLKLHRGPPSVSQGP